MRKREIVFLILALCLTASTAQADMVKNDGGTHNITSFVSGHLSVYDKPGNTGPPPVPPLTTTVNLQTGGQIEWSLMSFESSHVNVEDGSIGWSLNAYGSSLVNIYDGSIGNLLTTSDNSIANIYGGSIGNAINTWGTSTVNIYGFDFNYDYGPVTAMYGPLTGTLDNGDLLSLNFTRIDDSSNIILHEMNTVPLPGAALLGALGLITAGWRLRKRKTA